MKITVEIDNINNLGDLSAQLLSLISEGESTHPVVATGDIMPFTTPQTVTAAPVAPVPVQPVPVSFAPVPVQPVPVPAPISVPTAVAPTYSMDQLAVAATTLMDAGHQNDLLSLLGKFGVQALTQLPKEMYGAFATDLRALGAQL